MKNFYEGEEIFFRLQTDDVTKEIVEKKEPEEEFLPTSDLTTTKREE